MAAMHNQPATANRDEIVKSLQILMLPGQTIELRALGVDATSSKPRGHAENSFFTDIDALADAAMELDGRAKGTYSTPNPLKPGTPERIAQAREEALNLREELKKQRKYKEAKKVAIPSGAEDEDVQYRRWLMLDADPERQADMNSTDAEHTAALERMQTLQAFLSARGWPEGIFADSGNGGHGMYGIEVAADDDGLIERVLKVLGLFFSDAAVNIDQTVKNPARIWKLYGTVARKGENTRERPWRRARLLSVPEHIIPVSRAQLEMVAALLPEKKHAVKEKQSSGKAVDIETWFTEHDVEWKTTKQVEGGTLYALEECPWSEEHTTGPDGAFVIQWPDGKLIFRCHHSHCGGREWRDFREHYEPDAYERKQEPKREQASSASFHSASLASIIRMDSVETKPVAWLWEGRIPLGKVTMLDGDPGLGKTMLTADLAARITNNKPMPDGSRGVEGGAVLVTVEDDLGDTIRPRLEAAGADLSRILTIPSVKMPSKETGEVSERAFSVVTDLWLLEHAIQTVGAKLVVIDPIMACMGTELNSYRDQDVRAALTPLKMLAERTGSAVVIIRHLNKGSSDNALYRGGGSIGFIGAARSGLMITKHPDNEEQRILLPTKNNLACQKEPMMYHIETAENGVGKIAWDGTSELSAGEVLGANRQSETQQEIMRVLRDARGKVLSPKEVAEATGITESTVRVLLKRLERRGAVKSPSYGGYCVPLLSSVSTVSTVTLETPVTANDDPPPATRDKSYNSYRSDSVTEDIVRSASTLPTFKDIQATHPQRPDEPFKAWLERISREFYVSRNTKPTKPVTASTVRSHVPTSNIVNDDWLDELVNSNN